MKAVYRFFSLEIRIRTERIFEFMNLDFSFGQPLRTSLQKTFEKLTLRHLAESAVQNRDGKKKKRFRLFKCFKS